MVRPNSDDAGDVDNWYAVEDRRQRKRIQDRLAQRARRKRLAELHKGRSEKKSIGTATALNAAASMTPPLSDCTDALSTEAETSVMFRSPDASLIPVQAFVGSNMLNRRILEVEVPMTVWAALYINGSIMGLTCSTTYPAKSRPLNPSLPNTLQPTALQLITIHPTWIDRFPFPGMRDNLINAISIVEEEDFLRDLFCMSSFEIKPGGESWDPSAWTIGEEFGAKWGFLFTDYT